MNKKDTRSTIQRSNVSMRRAPNVREMGAPQLNLFCGEWQRRLRIPLLLNARDRIPHPWQLQPKYRLFALRAEVILGTRVWNNKIRCDTTTTNEMTRRSVLISWLPGGYRYTRLLGRELVALALAPFCRRAQQSRSLRGLRSIPVPWSGCPCAHPSLEKYLRAALFRDLQQHTEVSTGGVAQ